MQTHKCEEKASSIKPAELTLNTRNRGAHGWARRQENIRAMREGRYLDLFPETLELAPTLACPYKCRQCPYAKPCRLRLGQFATPDDVYTITLESAKVMIRRAAEAGAMWHLATGGGEPTTHPLLPHILAYAARVKFSGPSLRTSRTLAISG